MNTIDTVCIAIAIGITVPLIYHRLKYGSIEQQAIRGAEKWDCNPERIDDLEKALEDLRPIVAPEVIAKYEATQEVRRQNAKKYWP